MARSRRSTGASPTRSSSWVASPLAGMAFGNTGTHLGHALSYGVTHLMHDVTTEGYAVASPFVPHGISVIVSAPAIFRYTATAAPQRHYEAAGFLQSDLNGAGIDDSGEALANRIIGCCVALLTVHLTNLPVHLVYLA